MTKKSQIGALFSAAIFLLTLLMQPIHQLSHLSNHDHSNHSHETSNSESVQHESVCFLCDFTIPPISDFSLNQFELSISKTETFSVVSFELNQIYISEVLGIKQLRAPPVFV